MVTGLNILMTVSGLSFTYLASKKSVYSNWFLLLCVCASISLSMLLGLYTDVIKEVLITLPLAVLSLFSWYRKKKTTDMLVSKTSLRQDVGYFVLFLLTWFVVYFIMKNFQTNLLLLNTCAVSMGIVHMLYHSKLYYASWYIYIALNILYVAQFYLVFGLSFDFTLILVKNIIYTYLAVKGLQVWKLSVQSAV